jgi:hypothetical protein
MGDGEWVLCSSRAGTWIVRHTVKWSSVFVQPDLGPLKLKCRSCDERHKIRVQVLERSVFIGVGRLLYSPSHHPECTVRSGQLD